MARLENQSIADDGRPQGLPPVVGMGMDRPWGFVYWPSRKDAGMIARLRLAIAIAGLGISGMTLRAEDPGIKPAPTATVSGSKAVDPKPTSAAEARFRSDIGFLAHDAREGRAPGSAGIEAAAGYIAGMFEGAGLTPAPGADGFFQTFTISGQAKLTKPGELAFQGPEQKTIAAEKNEFSPLAIGDSGKLEGAPIVFAGYGITAKDSEKSLDYDDYAGIDAKKKLVIILRREPGQADPKSPFDGKGQSKYAALQHKISNASAHGASGVLLVNDFFTTKGEKEKDELAALNYAGSSRMSFLPFAMVSRALADKLLTAAGKPSLEALEKDIDSDGKPRSFEIPDWSARVKVEMERVGTETRNVVGVLEGAGPFAHETIVVGAHYDHLGRGGGLFSGSLAPFSKDIHNGADDNASGTAMMLEMARRLARRTDPLPRRIVFIAFSGEEKGLLGSQHYVEQPLYPLSDTVMMFNFDMVGRLNARDELTVYGTGTSPGLAALVDALGASAGLTIKKIADGHGPSDQQSFYLKDVPVLFAFTGTHTDYHRPSDDTNLINFPGMARIANLGELLLLDLARRPKRPEFTKVASKGGGADPGRVNISAYLGSIPDYNEDVKGVKLNGVREGSPAEKGGLKGGDVIVKFGDRAVTTIYDYTEALGKYKPDETVDVVVTRDGKEVTLKVKLGRKPSQ
jgi:Peptidase family M28/PDZ domain/PA domain